MYGPRREGACGGFVVDFECCIAAKIDGLCCCVDTHCLHALAPGGGVGSVCVCVMCEPARTQT